MTKTIYRFPKVFVAFGGNKTHWWTGFLKKGFYHCLIIFGDGRAFVLIDPVIGWTDIIFFNGEDIAEMFSSLIKQGYKTIVETNVQTEKQKCHLRPMTCVETVKRFLRIQNPFIFTPYQLYKHIKKESK